MSPLVSVIMPSYQKARFIAGAVESVLAQTFTDYELIVVDSSSDDTPAILERFEPTVRAIRTEPRGIAAARNVGVRASRGALVAFLDADDNWMPTKLERQVKVLESSPRVGLVCADVLFQGEEGLRPGRAFTDARPASGMIHPLVFSRSFIGTSTVVIRRSCFDEVGGFDESITACEDHDLWLRISRTWAIDYVDEPLAVYRYSAGQASADRERTLAGMRGAPHSGLIRVQERAYAASAEVRALDPETLDRSFFNLYLELARLYVRSGRSRLARPVLRQYRQARGVTSRYGKLLMASLLPARMVS